MGAYPAGPSNHHLTAPFFPPVTQAAAFAAACPPQRRLAEHWTMTGSTAVRRVWKRKKEGGGTKQCPLSLSLSLFFLSYPSDVLCQQRFFCFLPSCFLFFSIVGLCRTIACRRLPPTRACSHRHGLTMWVHGSMHIMSIISLKKNACWRK
jgi:hypothetical protein